MGAQGEALATRLQQATDQLIATIDGCPDAQWQTATTVEGWSAGVTAHHAAGSIEPTTGLLVAVATGAALPPLTAEAIDARNAQHAQQFAHCTKAETIALARQGVAQAASMLQGLGDEQLAHTATLALIGPQPVSAAQLGEFLVLGHLQGHLQSMQAAL